MSLPDEELGMELLLNLVEFLYKGFSLSYAYLLRRLLFLHRVHNRLDVNPNFFLKESIALFLAIDDRY